MYQVIGIKGTLKYAALIWALVVVILIFFKPPADLTKFHVLWDLLSFAVTISGALIALLGQTPIFPVLCRLPVIRNCFPDISGEWAATLESNWPIIQERCDPTKPAADAKPVTAKVTIISRLFFIRINLVADTKYSNSKTIFVRVSRDDEDGSVQLHYVYENTTLRPLPTDSGSHNGAACLRIDGSGRDLTLDGSYWTDRNWHKGLNTAGVMRLRRSS